MEFDWKAIVKTVAPVLGTALGGPLGGAALGSISRAILGPDAPPDEAAVAAALQTANPELLLKLKEADREFAVAIRKLDIDLSRLENDDRASAREREKNMRDWAPSVLAMVFVLGFFGAQYLVFTQPAPIGSEAMVARVLGTLDAAIIMILSYYYGTTRGSQRKTELLSQSTPAAPPAKT